MPFPFKAVVFDFDGTMVDTESAEVAVSRSLFREHGLEFPDEIWQDQIGKGAHLIQETPSAMLARLTGKDYGEIKGERDRRYHATVFREPFREGISELLEGLVNRDIRRAIASSSSHSWVDRHLTERGIFEHFQVICCSDDVERAKPFPDLYLLACERLEVSPSDAVAIEDSPNGIAAAKEAGLYTVAVPNPLTLNMDLSQADAIWPSAAAGQLWFSR